MSDLPQNIIIDFDSTIVKCEGLEKLAEISLKDNPDKESIVEAVKTITDMGMEGRISFADSLTRRLQLFGATKTEISLLVEYLKTHITDSFLKNKDRLTSIKDRIIAISGGFMEWVVPVSVQLGINPSRIFANRFIFNNNEEVLGVDTENELSKENGKVKVVKSLCLKGETVIIGDGFTDYQVKESGLASKLFLFTENIKRDSLIEKAYLVLSNLDEFFLHYEGLR